MYCFPKYDGSNIRVTWVPKKGFTKFGSRHCLLDEKSNDLGRKAIPLIKAEEEAITSILKPIGNKEVTLFFEFFGSDSFAGSHNFNATDHELKLIDASFFKQGFLNPNDFIKVFGDYDKVAPCIYHGKMNNTLIKQIEEGSLDGMAFEGVVCKTNRDRPNCQEPVMFKVKNKAWINRLFKKYVDNPEMIKELL